MRIHILIPSLLCSTLGTFQTLATPVPDVTAINPSGAAHYHRIHRSPNGSSSWEQVVGWTTSNPGTTINYDDSLGYYPPSAQNPTYFRVQWTDDFATILQADISPALIADGDRFTSTFGSVTHNYCCVYCINWTNTGTTYATPTMIAIDGSNNVTELGFNLSVVAPGLAISRCYTNCYGSNAPPGGCGYALFGDTRPNKTVPDVTVNGTQYDYPTNPGNGSGGTTQPGPIIDPSNTNSPAHGSLANTNLATSGDINRLGDSLIKAIAKLEVTTDRINTNLARIDIDLNSDFTNLRTNLLSAINGLTNGFGNDTNTAALSNLWAIRTTLTNLYGISSNIAALSTNGAIMTGLFENITNGVIWGLSNALWMTNLPLAGSLANWFTNFSTNFDRIEQFRTGYGNTTSGLNAIGNGTEPEAEWGVIPLTDMWGNPLFGVLAPGIDLKPGVSLQPLEDYVPGFRTWFRLVVLWFTTALALFWIAAEIRLALFQALAIPALPGAGDTKLLMGIGTLAGPVGAGTGAAAGLTLKITSAIILISSLIFLPTILVNLAETVMQLWPSVSDALAANSAITILPGAAPKAVYLISMWFPLIPLCVLGVNFLIAKLGIDNTVSFMLLYIKVTQE